MVKMSAAADAEEELPYEIHSWSSYSAQYYPRNIQEDKPCEQSSRWSSNTTSSPQYIMLKLLNPSVVRSITFGKFHKLHVCNLKEFKVYGGVSEDKMRLLLHTGLRNDHEPETFKLTDAPERTCPCNFIRIVPLHAFKANFNYSIWYVRLTGTSDPEETEKAARTYRELCEKKATRLCLKHLRQRGLWDAFHALQEQTNTQLEHPTLTKLHKALVSDGDFAATEEILHSSCQEDLFSEYLDGCCCVATWKRLLPDDGVCPGVRGGHQLCIDHISDPSNPRLYLFGGWDGSNDLADFWRYYINTNRWELISVDTSVQGGPSPRSCHKMCIDPLKQRIYTMGRYVDVEADRHKEGIKGDFYCYNIQADKWTCLSTDTASVGGPMLVYDHQMVMEAEKQIIYVFGGRTISEDQVQFYSGLYAYHVEDGRWKLIRDCRSDKQLKSRIGHSMLYNKKSSKLYIFAGQRYKDYLSDFLTYDVENDVVDEICRDSSRVGGPDAGFTQRATFDEEHQEIYILSGLMRDRESSAETVKNSFWSYSLHRRRWKCIYSNENTDKAYWEEMKDIEPRPRFAHQLVYYPPTGQHFLFGGNPGDTERTRLRLNDLWTLNLQRVAKEEALRRALFIVRCLRFRELCVASDSISALKYLRTEVSEVTDHTDPECSAQFRSLAALVFRPSSSFQLYDEKLRVFEELSGFFPESMSEPKDSIVDMVWTEETMDMR